MIIARTKTWQHKCNNKNKKQQQQHSPRDHLGWKLSLPQTLHYPDPWFPYRGVSRSLHTHCTSARTCTRPHVSTELIHACTDTTYSQDAVAYTKTISCICTHFGFSLPSSLPPISPSSSSSLFPSLPFPSLAICSNIINSLHQSVVWHLRMHMILNKKNKSLSWYT